MMDHSENTLRAAIKSLRDTVAPAVDPGDPQAVEQLRLTIDFLEFLRTRVYDIHARQRYELGRQMDIAQALLDDAALLSPEVGDRLTHALADARSVFGDAEAHTQDLRASSQQLWAVVRGIVRTARQAPEEVRERISTKVIGGIEPLIEMESAWFLPFGFEPDPGSVPQLTDLLERVSSDAG
ncbi:hypothetical protein ACVH9Z_02275 [Rhodococcus opacus]|uniref:hypothetical protein n=1 Tax=Rhodococcus opacus TaxID=37919 RepID=UPI000A502FED|nr:hypothetical protein [Rhodococcus opacus]MBA8961870.1 hypothetical protein [Rhodococcus opacus]MBP2209602.1 hypothetical protein [Rhodococcus opacus]MDJ0415851.1 hypothetical protein [Rhodococcus opacus]